MLGANVAGQLRQIIYLLRIFSYSILNACEMRNKAYYIFCFLSYVFTSDAAANPYWGRTLGMGYGAEAGPFGVVRDLERKIDILADHAIRQKMENILFRRLVVQALAQQNSQGVLLNNRETRCKDKRRPWRREEERAAPTKEVEPHTRRSLPGPSDRYMTAGELMRQSGVPAVPSGLPVPSSVAQTSRQNLHAWPTYMNTARQKLLAKLQQGRHAAPTVNVAPNHSVSPLNKWRRIMRSRVMPFMGRTPTATTTTASVTPTGGSTFSSLMRSNSLPMLRAASAFSQFSRKPSGSFEQHSPVRGSEMPGSFTSYRGAGGLNWHTNPLFNKG